MSGKKSAVGNFSYEISFHSFAPVMQETVTRDRIKKAAHDLVMRYGIRSVSMDDFASNLGMSKKTIYQYYKDKDELVDAVISDIINRNKEICVCDRQESRDAIHELFLALDMMSVVMESLNPVVMFDMQKYHPACFGKFLKHKDEYLYNVVKQNLIRGISEDLYRTDLNVELMARFRVDSILIPFNPGFTQNVKMGLDEAHKELLIHYLYGIVNPKGYKLIQKYQKQRNDKAKGK
ncbi:MAG: TetR/AcrR family transcriptional regulator [Chitinophagaceae bacterium]|nr:MAG: TetR/AcrR family transcriptional regulator [Chitinophagaceae bacterium]